MARIKSQGNASTEQRLMRVFRERRLTGWRRNYPLFGKPDFVFPAARLAIFVDGIFWHGHPRKCRMPHTNRRYWVRKIARNVARDKLVSRMLREKGWNVIRIWEDAVRKNSMVARIEKALKSHE
jgi:DNA mismatch endonuclease (patch repair protein)